jgi:ABC-type transport system involved in multi-copper enzyme maturation permease subunit
MIWKIAKKDFLLNLMTFKFAVGTVLCVVLMAVFMPVLVNDYQQRLKTYNDNVARNEAELRKVRVYKSITPTIYRRPTVLSVFSQGLERQLGNSAKMKLGSVPGISAAAATGNPYLAAYSVLDACLIFKIVISVLALLVAYDVVAGEREQGTLKLMVSGTIARYQVLLGKLLAGLITLLVPVTISYIAGLLILLFFPMAELTVTDWIRIGLMYLATLIFVSAMYNIGLLFSCLLRRSAISLVLALFVWIVLVVVIPNVSVYLAAQIRPIEARKNIDSQIESIWKKFDGEMYEYNEENPPIGPADWGPGAFGNLVLSGGTIAAIEAQQQLLDFQISRRIEYADKQRQVEQSYLHLLFQQEHLANTLSSISPISLYENVLSRLSQTDLTYSKSFFSQAKTYRNALIDFISSNTNDFSSSSYFTQFSEQDAMIYEKNWEAVCHAQNEAEKNRAMDIFTQFISETKKNWAPLYSQDLPQFVYQAESVIKNLQRIIPGLGRLIFISLLFFALSFVAFQKYDVR